VIRLESSASTGTQSQEAPPSPESSGAFAGRWARVKRRLVREGPAARPLGPLCPIASPAAPASPPESAGAPGSDACAPAAPSQNGPSRSDSASTVALVPATRPSWPRAAGRLDSFRPTSLPDRAAELALPERARPCAVRLSTLDEVLLEPLRAHLRELCGFPAELLGLVLSYSFMQRTPDAPLRHFPTTLTLLDDSRHMSGFDGTSPFRTWPTRAEQSERRCEAAIARLLHLADECPYELDRLELLSAAADLGLQLDRARCFTPRLFPNMEWARETFSPRVEETLGTLLEYEWTTVSLSLGAHSLGAHTAVCAGGPCVIVALAERVLGHWRAAFCTPLAELAAAIRAGSDTASVPPRANPRASSRVPLRVVDHAHSGLPFAPPGDAACPVWTIQLEPLGAGRALLHVQWTHRPPSLHLNADASLAADEAGRGIVLACTLHLTAAPASLHA
jgi:hypothetical protein